MKTNILVTVGCIISIALNCVKHYVVPVPDIVYFPVMLLSIILVVIGINEKRKNSINM